MALAGAICLLNSQASVLQAARQDRDDRGDSCKCDFSKYKALEMSHVLLNSAVKRVEPVYPPVAKAAKAQGKVEVRILVDRNGDVIDACVVEGHPLLQPTAKDAALQWKFKKNFGLLRKQKQRYIEGSLFFTFELDSAPGSSHSGGCLVCKSTIWSKTS